MATNPNPGTLCPLCLGPLTVHASAGSASRNLLFCPIHGDVTARYETKEPAAGIPAPGKEYNHYLTIAARYREKAEQLGNADQARLFLRLADGYQALAESFGRQGAP
jgi:hypothetical protein